MIELQHVCKDYPTGRAIDDLSLTIADGELLVLLGGSGCGKTTTLKTINRLLDPTSGRVLLDGRDVATVPGHELRRQIGYAFQKVGLFPHMTVADNVGITLRLLDWPAARIQHRVDELLELVELAPDDMRARFPSQLSGGQQQRVGVARALAASPRVVLLDEPFGALDPLTRDRLQRSFDRIRRRLALTAVFVTHDMVEALLLGDRIAVLHDGRLVQVGTPHDLIERPADDYVRQLMETPQRQAARIDELAARRVAT